MSENYNGDYGTHGRSDGSYSRYSRSAGVSSYHKRRRQSTVFRVVLFSMLAVIVGGAIVMIVGHFVGKNTAPVQSASEQVSKQEISTAQPAEITLVASGDVVMNSAVVESGRKDSGAYGFDHLFEHIRSELSGVDIRIVSQETNLPGSKFGFGNSTPLNAPQELGRAEMSAGFNVVLRATDHTLDNGHEGLHNEIEWWDDEYPDTPLLGIAEPDPEENPDLNDYVNNVYMFDKEGFKIAIINHSGDIGEDDHGVVSPLEEEKIRQDVQKARDEGANIVVACPHWGNENETETSEEQETFVWAYANAGVDLVIGNHPRVLQRTEVLHTDDGHTTVCFFPLGCLISSLNNENLLGGLAEVTFSRNDHGECSVSSAKLKPVVTHRDNTDGFTVYLLSNYTEQLAHSGWDYLSLDTLNERCTEILGEGYNADEGVLNIAL
jgi:poly-gamma-glutamate synthesis protein (capsule biosynthesis protein)